MNTSVLLACSLAACLFVATGCAQRVKIVVPASDAPIAERVTAYNAYRPKESLTVTFRGDTSESIKLGNDEYVSFPADLLPAVEPASKTAAHIDRHLDYELASNVVAGGTFATTVGWVTSIFAYGFTDGATYTKPLPLTLLLVSLGGIIVNGFVLGPEAAKERVAAFESYDTDLLGRLRLNRQARVRDLEKE